MFTLDFSARAGDLINNCGQSAEPEFALIAQGDNGKEYDLFRGNADRLAGEVTVHRDFGWSKRYITVKAVLTCRRYLGPFSDLTTVSGAYTVDDDTPDIQATTPNVSATIGTASKYYFHLRRH